MTACQPEYVLAFVLDCLLARVVLLHKTHGPKTAIGWNGLGGRIEPDEDPRVTATRETFKEAGVLVAPERWLPIGHTQNGIVLAFAASTPGVWLAKPRTEEHVELVHVMELPPMREMAHDALWFISTARVRLRVQYHEAR